MTFTIYLPVQEHHHHHYHHYHTTTPLHNTTTVTTTTNTTATATTINTTTTTIHLTTMAASTFASAHSDIAPPSPSSVMTRPIPDAPVDADLSDDESEIIVWKGSSATPVVTNDSRKASVADESDDDECEIILWMSTPAPEIPTSTPEATPKAAIDLDKKLQTSSPLSGSPPHAIFARPFKPRSTARGVSDVKNKAGPPVFGEIIDGIHVEDHAERFRRLIYEQKGLLIPKAVTRAPAQPASAVFKYRPESKRRFRPAAHMLMSPEYGYNACQAAQSAGMIDFDCDAAPGLIPRRRPIMAMVPVHMCPVW